MSEGYAYIRLTDGRQTPSGKTLLWDVVTVDDNTLLGRVRWFAPWRKYVFAPLPDTLFEQDCLRTIAGQIEQKTAEHRSRLRMEKQSRMK